MLCVGVRRCIRKTRGWDARQISLEWDSERKNRDQLKPSVLPPSFESDTSMYAFHCDENSVKLSDLWSLVLNSISGPKTFPALRHFRSRDKSSSIFESRTIHDCKLKWFCTHLQMHSMVWISDWPNWWTSQRKFCLPNPTKQNQMHALTTGTTRSWFKTTLEH